jgi:hypothetical protein
MALALAIFALVVIGGMVAGNFFVGLLEQQSGRNLLLTTEAAAAAEGELSRLVAAVPAASLLSLTPGGEPLRPEPVSGVGITSVHQVVRLADNLFLVRTRSVRQDAAGGSLAERSVGLLAELVPDSTSGGQTLIPIAHRPWLQLY